MLCSANLGFPRIGQQRELKKAVEGYWAGKLEAVELERCAQELRQTAWELQRQAGIQQIPTGDFSYYDHVLDMALTLGAVPSRYRELRGLERTFAMARGTADLPALEMTKWFDSNYHYIVPELEAGLQFTLDSSKPVSEFLEAKALGIPGRPVLLGPVSFLLLAKSSDPERGSLDFLEQLLPCYCQLLGELAAAGAEWVQLDEPCLVGDLDEASLAAYTRAYQELSPAGQPKLLLATYFEALPAASLACLSALEIDGLHIDLIRGRGQLDAVLAATPEECLLSLGVVDGRNVWCNHLEETLDVIESALAKRPREQLQIAPSCSLLFCPYDLDLETQLPTELKSWMAFAKQKLEELQLLCTAVNEGRQAVESELASNSAALKARRESSLIVNNQVQDRLSNITPDMLQRGTSVQERREIQSSQLHLPALPTTTIGSYPQTDDVRKKRAAFRRGEITQEGYEQFLQESIADCIRFQEEIGLDVLVHGEFERNDMVEYFGEQLQGFAFTEHAWVQSYGTRAVKPPIIYGDVSRRAAMTVAWSSFAQSCTKRPVKGMLTGPVTILQWSFVRDDQARETTCRQIALAIRDEVQDLEEAGIRVIQIDEPAFREALPLQRAKWEHYLGWAVGCFRLASSSVKDGTQIHTHMCYSEFNDIIEPIAALDADVISIESSRSRMELLDAFVDYDYPAGIGPGVYDIHSPRVPSNEEICQQLQEATQRLNREQVWVNPDCGLKTRHWDEIKPALNNMVEAARMLRKGN